MKKKKIWTCTGNLCYEAAMLDFPTSHQLGDLSKSQSLHGDRRHPALKTRRGSNQRKGAQQQSLIKY